MGQNSQSTCGESRCGSVDTREQLSQDEATHRVPQKHRGPHLLVQGWSHEEELLNEGGRKEACPRRVQGGLGVDREGDGEDISQARSWETEFTDKLLFLSKT